MFNISFPRQEKNATEVAQTARNEALSYFNFNGQRIDQLKVAMWEGNQRLLDRLYSEGLNQTRGARIKVVFLLPDTSLWDVYAPIHARLIRDERFTATVIAFRRCDIAPDKTVDEVAAFFDERGIACRLEGYDAAVTYSPITIEDADIIFYTLGSAAYPPPYKIEYTSLYCRTCYLSYGVLLANQENYQFDQDFHHAAWAIYAATDREAGLYRKYSKRICGNVVLSGYPKFDVLRNAGQGRSPRPLVIWAPHWTIGLVYPQLNYGMFDKVCMGMIDLIKRHPDCDFVYKPHPNLPYALKQTTFMDETAYGTYLSMLGQLPNCRTWKHGDYAELFRNSTMMVTDSISFLAEYLVTGNPLMFMDRPDRIALNDVGEELIELHYKGTSIADIENFIEQQIRDDGDYRRVERMSQGNQVLGITDRSASDSIVNHLEAAFGLEKSQY